ncbi:MAG: DUF308 domain-containing protein [Coriobacteriales bacterium]|nr:DUF308 domain-containing protein [Coriobacteriales bacterium]
MSERNISSNNTNSTSSKADKTVEVDVLTERFIGGNKVWGAIIGIVMAILGILFIVKPLQVAFALDIVVTVGFLLFGIYQIFSYFQTPTALRSGWQLAFGIVWVLMAIMIVTSGWAGIILAFAFALGFLALLSGIMQISVYAAIREQPGAVLILTSGIINALLGIFLLFAPFFATAIVEVAQGIYLLFAGIALIFEALSGHAHRKA